MTKFLAVFDDANGNRECAIYTRWDTYHSATFSPTCKEIFLMDMSKVSGKTYSEKKANLENKAIEYSNMMGEIYPISYGEIAEIEDFFRTYGKRYGLLREFRENAIC